MQNHHSMKKHTNFSFLSSMISYDSYISFEIVLCGWVLCSRKNERGKETPANMCRICAGIQRGFSIYSPPRDVSV